MSFLQSACLEANFLRISLYAVRLSKLVRSHLMSRRESHTNVLYGVRVRKDSLIGVMSGRETNYFNPHVYCQSKMGEKPNAVLRSKRPFSKTQVNFVLKDVGKALAARNENFGKMDSCLPFDLIIALSPARV
jgi:hypothetical protein